MNLPRITSAQFLQKLKKSPLENIETIKEIETALKKNGGLFKMPKPGESVILLVSGGLDSIVCWHLLMEKYKLKVYPLSIDNGYHKRKFEKKSVLFFAKYFQKKYPKLYVAPFFLHFSIPQLKIEMNTKQIDPEFILDNLAAKSKTVINLSLGSSSFSPILGKLYSEYLQYTKNIITRIIFCGYLASDGQGIPEQTFTSLRANTWHLQTTTTDNRWQYSSPFLEKEIGCYLTKKDLIKWGNQHHLPLEKTWSCYRHYSKHCGTCIACIARKEAFAKAKISDKTEYQTPHVSLIPLIINKTKQLPIYISLKNIKIKILNVSKK